MLMRFHEDYKPLYFLAALGSGGLSVSFFMYLMFMVKHPDTPVPTYDHLTATLTSGSTPMRVTTVAALVGVGWFAVAHVRLLISNIRAYRAFAKTPGYQALRSSNAEVSLMAIPLTYAMSVNVAFIIGALAVPGLWNVVEYLFPVALVAFSAIGLYAAAIFGRYLTRVLAHTGFDFDDTNHFSQVLPAFAFAMIAVGFSASAAMSHSVATSVFGMFGTFVFFAASMMWIIIKLSISFASMLRNGMAVEAGPTLWIGIPILTLFGIAFLRVGAGIAHNITRTEFPPFVALVMFGITLAAQLTMGVFGWMVMRRQGYFRDFVLGDRRSIPSYGLICPGVALSVLSMFFIHWGLVRNGVVQQYSLPYFALIAAVAAVQVLTIATLARLNQKLLGTPVPAVASAAAQPIDEPVAV